MSVNMLSNSDFFTGAFPAEYGNATSGVFDLKLRKGNHEKREYSVQVGVLGADIAAEGPVSYTHLDVYKRQAFDQGVAKAFDFPGFVPAYIRPCLLYTSRCV